MQYTVNVNGCKNDIFQLNFFLIFAQNIDYRYTLDLLCQGGSNENNLCLRAKVRKIVYPVNPSITI